MDVVDFYVAVGAPSSHELIIGTGLDAEDLCIGVSEKIHHSRFTELCWLNIDFSKFEVFLWNGILRLAHYPLDFSVADFFQMHPYNKFYSLNINLPFVRAPMKQKTSKFLLESRIGRNKCQFKNVQLFTFKKIEKPICSQLHFSVNP